MAKYYYKCKRCGDKAESTNTDLIYCNECEQYDCMVRDYKREAVGIDRSSLRG